MFTDHIEMIAKSARLLRTFLALSLLLSLVLPANCFAKDNHSSSSSPSKVSVPESDKTEESEGEVEESKIQDPPKNQRVKAENYKRSWDDAMVAAPAFGD